MNNWHWLRVCGDRTQFCYMKGDFTWEDFGSLGLLLGLFPCSLLELSNCVCKNGTSPAAGVTEHRHGKREGRDLAASVQQHQPVWGAGTHQIPAVGSCLPWGLLLQLWDLWPCTLLLLLGMTWAVCKTNSNLLVPDDKFTHWLGVRM